MIGKLQGWRGEHKKEAAQDKMRVGGFVSFEDLDRKSPNKTAVKKRAPRLSIGRRSFSLGPSKPGEDPFLTQPTNQDLSLFSNIPAATSAGLDRPPSSSAFQPSPPRPRTADPDHSLHRLRSRTAPPVPTDNPRSPWADKPLPLAIDFDQARKRSSSISSQRPSIQTLQDDSRSSYGASISRPKTSSSVDPSHRRKRSGSFTRPPAATPSYSLTPTITPQHSRRPSMTGTQIQINRTSQNTLNKSNSTASTNGALNGNRASSSSRASVNTQTTPKANGVKSPTESHSILDEVEGTLSATITELQELQTGYTDDNNYNPPPTAQRRRPTEPPKSAPANQGYFAQRSQYPSTSNSLPPTPIVAVSDESDDRLQSIQTAYDKQKRDMHTVLVENETLKKQLSLVQTRLADIDTIRIERDQFEQMYQETQINLQTVLDKLKLSRDNEEASRNNVSALERRLEEANMHKVDVLDHHHELEDEMKLMEQRHKALREEKERVEQKRLSFEADRSVLHQEIAKLPALHQEIAKLRQRPQQSALDEAQNSLRLAEERAKKLEEQLDSGESRADLPAIVADLGFKMEDLQRGLSTKDQKIADLEAANKSLSKGAKIEKNYANKIRGLERTVAEQHKTFRTIQAERDQLRQLIHTEFRRTANEVQKRQHPATTLLEKKVEVDAAILEVRKKAQEFLRSQKRRDEDLSSTRAVRIEELQQEIDYHVKDIVLYKLDVKGYKKDLKRAQTKLQRLEGIYSHGNGLMSQYSSKDSNATRPSLSSGNSENSVQQFGTADLLSDEENSPPGQRRGKRLSVHAYSPDGSPVNSPRKEKRQLNFVGAGI